MTRPRWPHVGADSGGLACAHAATPAEQRSRAPAATPERASRSLIRVVLPQQIAGVFLAVLAPSCATRLPRRDAAPGLRNTAQAAQGEQPGGARGGAGHRVRRAPAAAVAFKKITLPLIEGLGRATRACGSTTTTARSTCSTRTIRASCSRRRREHGACPEMITPELVARAGHIDTIVCHTDFDGLASAAKWIRGGVEPYPGCDDDARAIDTRIGTPSAVARAHRSRAAGALSRSGSVRRDRAAPGDGSGGLGALATDRRSRGRADPGRARDAPRSASLQATRARAWRSST